MRNIALFLTYLGTNFHGWQMQKDLPTVQETMEKAICKVVGHPVHVTGCGRTDAGVHARCYVANFKTASTIPVDRLPYALNTHLPADVVVTKAFDVHENFNAIGSCAKKEYTYQIYNSRVRDPFYVNRAWFYPRHLNEEIMQRAADQFVGEHDFAAVRSVGTDVRSTVRTVYYYNVERCGDMLLLKVCANGFLYNMARAMAGTIVYAAEGKFPPEEIGRILKEGNRTAAGPTVPAGGLYMTHLWYDDGAVKFECPDQEGIYAT
ncbi:MAG: tRNA pseudouridine(38-40) synthase TruA [Oscillospiraceae bacterium]|nr:tRNA pseudouridine(38-40) synthase TruA [Oscillospiraceae bacterium]